jgi:hypothetical protein
MNPKCLPAEYGGTLELPRIDGCEWYKMLSLCEKEFEGNISLVIKFKEL